MNDNENDDKNQFSSAGGDKKKEIDIKGENFTKIPPDTIESAKNSDESLTPEEVSPTAVSPDDVLPASPQKKVKPPPQSSPTQDAPLQKISHDPRIRRLFKWGIIGVLAFFVISILFSLLGPREPVTLVYWGVNEDKETIQPLISDYQAKNKEVKIEYVKMTPDKYREKLIARAKDGRGPDIFKFHNTWLPEMGDVVAPVPSSVFSSEEFEEAFYPVHKKDLSVSDVYYGVPLSIDGLVLIYNQDLFKKAGIDNEPASWEDVINASVKLTVKEGTGAIITSGIALGNATNVEHFSDIFGLFLVQNGASLTTLTSPEAVEALDSYRKFAAPPENYWDESFPPSLIAFAQEKVGMIIAPSSDIAAIRALNPEIKLKVTGVPIIPGNPPVSLATYWAEGVSRYSNNQQEAWKFLKYLAQKDSLKRRFEEASKTKGYGDPYPRRDMASLLADNPLVGAVVKQAPTYVSLPIVSKTYDNGLNDEMNIIIANAINATFSGFSPAEALQKASEDTAIVLKKYGLE